MRRVDRLLAGCAFVAAFLMLSGCGAGGSSADASAQQARQPRPGQKQANTAGDYATTVQELYVAYFGRPADPNGLVNFENALLATGVTPTIEGINSAYATNAGVAALVNSFGTSAESQRLYGNGDATSFVTAVFQNVLGRQPLSSGLSFWVDSINSGSVSRGDAALQIMEGALTNNTAQGVIDGQLIENRLAVAAYFTSQVAVPSAVGSYSGSSAANAARSMLADVTSTTDPTSFESTVDATVLDLVEADTGGGFTRCAGAGLSAAVGNLCFANTPALSVNGSLNAVAFGNGMWVAVGSNATIATSTDGANWTQQNPPAISNPNGTLGFTNVSYGDGMWVAVGQLPGVAIYSTDGVNWSVGNGIGSGFSPGSPRSLAYGNGKWIAVDSVSEYITTDGKNWVLANPTLTYVDNPSVPSYNPVQGRIAFGNNTWLGETSAVSSDGVTWTSYLDPLSTFTSQNGLAVYGGGNWVGVQTYSDALWTSVDAVNWNQSLQLSDSSLFNYSLESMAYGYGTYVVVGNYGDSGLIATTNTLGSAWISLENNPNIGGMFSAAYGNGRWVLVGAGATTAGGAILVSTSASLTLQ